MAPLPEYTIVFRNIPEHTTTFWKITVFFMELTLIGLGHWNLRKLRQIIYSWKALYVFLTLISRLLWRHRCLTVDFWLKSVSADTYYRPPTEFNNRRRWKRSWGARHTPILTLFHKWRTQKPQYAPPTTRYVIQRRWTRNVIYQYGHGKWSSVTKANTGLGE